ncbi:MAG: Peptide methionine sulfoxide reductase msrA [Patescibacteria group bacterium]|nr:Peptide methionine sulfoxide reductase msrA [Patescibacteria group bacterium]
MNPDAPANQTAVLGGGCFWCLEAAYQEIEGIGRVVSGYAGGQVPNPSYEQVSGGATGHAEVVQLTFHPNVVTYADILDIFWAIHDPTTPGRQGHDVGPQYRSIILYADDEQKRLAESSKQHIQTLWPQPVITEIVPLEAFYPAEKYHQNYFRSHPEQAYCQAVINPKLQKLREKFHDRLKQEAA